MKKLILFLVVLCGFIQTNAQSKISDMELGVSVYLTDENMEDLFKAANKYGIKHIELVLPRYEKTNIKEYLSAIDKASKLLKREKLNLWSVHIPFS